MARNTGFLGESISIDLNQAKKLSSSLGFRALPSFVIRTLYRYMKPSPDRTVIDTHASNPSGTIYFALALFGLFAPVFTFAIAASDLDRNAKTLALASVGAVYLVICVWSLWKMRPGRAGHAETEMGGSVADKLIALEEAKHFFGNSIKPEDMFRLVSSRVGEIYPFAASVLFVRNPASSTLKIVHADGRNAEELKRVEIEADQGLAGLAFLSREIETDRNLHLDKEAMPPDALHSLRSAVAVPLTHENEVFGVLQLYSESDFAADESSRENLAAIGERVAPLLLGSMAFERSLSNALTDTLTNLPNERAFFMILENQLAESLRFRDDRPLTVLTLDIMNFAEANANYGHAAGDRILGFAANEIGRHLRKMDFLARSVNDEFIVILPTAPEKTAFEIIERIRNGLAATPFPVSDTEEIKIWLNFGWATFWKDGETAQQLLQNAQLRKQQAKSEEPSKVLWFPKEYVN